MTDDDELALLRLMFTLAQGLAVLHRRHEALYHALRDRQVITEEQFAAAWGALPPGPELAGAPVPDVASLLAQIQVLLRAVGGPEH
jgi:N-acetylglutamate synthase-like GNAT family acetyltransferase